MAVVSLIVAMTNDRVIGADNGLPWRLPADLKRFKAITMGKPILMGRKTWESIGRPLPGRRNIVISRNPEYVAEGAEVLASLEDALAASADAEEVMIMGGANIYEQALPLVDKMYLTLIDLDVAGDAHFPAFDMGDWQQVAEEVCLQDAVAGQPAFQYRFVDLVRQ